MSGSVADDEAVVGAVDSAVLAEGGAYGGVTAAPLDGEKPKKPAAKKPDLVIAAIFNREKGSDENALIAAGKWSPATADFVAVAEAGPRKGTTTSCKNLGDLFGALQDEPVGSLSRVVIVSHSTDEVIGLGGRIDADGTVQITGSVDGNPLAGGITFGAIADLAKDYQPMLDEVKTRWAEGGAEIVFFSCNSGEGVTLALMQDFGRLLGATAKGYSYSIGYCLENGRGWTTRTRYEGKDDQRKLVIDCANARFGYAHLKPDRS